MANTTNTGLSVSGTSNLSSGQKILIASAQVAFEPAAPGPDLIRSERMPEGHKQWDIQTYGRMADASSLTEGVDLAQSQQLFANTVTVTPDEKGILAQVSKRLIRRQGDSSIVGTTGTLIANSLRRLQDKNVVTLFDGLSKSVVGASATLDITHFRGSVAYLLTDNDTEFGPAPLPLHADLHIEQISDIILDITDPGAVVSSRFGMSADMLQRWWKGSDRLYGVQVFHGGNIARDSASDSKGALFASSFAAQVMAMDAEATEESDNSLRATEYGIFQEWSEAEIADPHGVEVYSDTTATV